jgi:tetratricopeptide (TPR) repeat protein
LLAPPSDALYLEAGSPKIDVGDWADAKAAYEKALIERPRSGFPLYGIAMSSEKAGDAEAAAKEYADFLAAWKDADPTLGQVTHAQPTLPSIRSLPKALNEASLLKHPTRLF